MALTSTPDLTLILSADGVIQEAIVGASLADESTAEWVGQPWESTVTDVGPKKVRRLLETARGQGVGGFSQITQKLPSGRELLMEFSAVRTDPAQDRFVAVGKNLGMVVEQQQKLIAAQQAIELNHWKLREFEARYNAVIKSTSEAVVLLQEKDLEIIEANARARELLDLPNNKQVRATLDLGNDTDRLKNILSETRRSGHAPSTLVHLNQGREQWQVRATSIHGAQDVLFLLQFNRVELWPATRTQIAGRSDQSVVIIDPEGIVMMASDSFAELIGSDGTSTLLGENVSQWIDSLDMKDFSPGANIYNLETLLISKSGNSRPITIFVSSLTAAATSGFALTIELSTPVSNVH